MQLKGAIKGLTILFGLIFLYTLSFTVVTKRQEKKAYNKAQEMVYPKDEQTGEALPVTEAVQKAINEAMTKRHLDEGQAMNFVANKIENDYLDSISNVTVYNLGIAKFSYREAKENEINLGLDLKGGMNVTLEVSVKEIVASLAGAKANEPDFQQALQLASERHKKSEGNFVTLFGQAFEEVNPEGSLAPYFLFEFKDKIDINSSNNEVLKVLREECDVAFDNSFEILKKRIDRFGVSQPIVQKLGNSGRILIELPGVKDPERVRKLLQGTAQLEFYETYNYDELYELFLQANAKLAEQNKAKKELTETKENQEAEELEVTEPTADEESNEASLIEQLEKEDNEANLVADDADNPLFALLRSPGYAKSACVGYALVKDTARINLMLEETANLFPPKMKLAWSVKPEKKFENDDALYLDLVALKLSQENKCAVASDGKSLGEHITDSRQDFGQSGHVEVELQMDNEGAKAWKMLTSKNIERQVAIVLDDYVYSYPVVRMRSLTAVPASLAAT